MIQISGNTSPEESDAKGMTYDYRELSINMYIKQSVWD